jgi:hypothetical protein
MVVLNLAIPSGQALSDALQISSLQISYGLRIARIGMPDAWSAAAPLTFQIAPDGTNYRDLYHVAQSHEGPWVLYEVSTQVIPNSMLTMPPDMGASLGWFKIRPGTRSQPVNQAADRTFALVFESNP